MNLLIALLHRHEGNHVSVDDLHPTNPVLVARLYHELDVLSAHRTEVQPVARLIYIRTSLISFDKEAAIMVLQLDFIIVRYFLPTPPLNSLLVHFLLLFHLLNKHSPVGLNPSRLLFQLLVLVALLCLITRIRYLLEVHVPLQPF